MTVFEKIKEELNEEQLAKMLINTCLVNNQELHYVTNTGQLFPFTPNGYSSAINYVMQQLESEAN